MVIVKEVFMKLIEREFYLSRLISTMDTPDIKVITGVRRSGKSKLLEAFKIYISDSIKDYNVIHINFNKREFDDIKDAKLLYDYISNKYVSGKSNFILIDEVQMCNDFEKVINWLHAEEKYDIYITGSNAFLLSSDLATLFTGRTFEIKMFPFSFKEYLKYNNSDDIYNLFDRYVLDGGMAGSYLYNNSEDKYEYLKDVYNTLIMRDIIKKYKIRNVEIINSLNDFLMDNISNLVSSRSITKEISKNIKTISDKTISKYINYLCSAFMYYRVRRYDIQGKKYLSSQDKFYLVDHSFKYALIGTKNMNYGRIYENMVAIELLRRGYELYVGVLHNKEIDFVAIKKDEKIYIQVSDDISNEKTFNREVAPLLQIRDAYPKMVIARTRHDDYQYEGIKIIDIGNFLGM